MVPDVLRSLWTEPRPADPPGPLPRDWALVAGLTCWSVVEAVIREDMAPIPLLLTAIVAPVTPLPWRRRHPLHAVAVAFGTLAVIDVARIVSGSDGALPLSVSATLILTYALFRWGSGRAAAYGLGLILIWLSMTLTVESTSVAETVAGYAFFCFAAALGAAIRYRVRIRIRDIDQAKAREREQLARELHDTVAHHVSGIAIQAQAGRAIATADPDRAIETLATIEDAATRTLTELRHMVGMMRASPTPSSRHSRGSPRSSGLPPMAGSRPSSRWCSPASWTTCLRRSAPRSTGSPRSPSPTPGGMPGRPPGSPWLSQEMPTRYA